MGGRKGTTIWVGGWSLTLVMVLRGYPRRRVGKGSVVTQFFGIGLRKGSKLCTGGRDHHDNTSAHGRQENLRARY